MMGRNHPRRFRFKADRRARWTAFTLVEMLLVVAIIGITSVIAIPYMVRSIQGNRLRTAIRTVVMAGRYSRSMALLRQQELTLTFDLAHSSLSVQPVSGATTPPPSPLPNEKTPSFPPTPNTDEPAPSPTSSSEAYPIGIQRDLDQVTIEWIEIDGEPPQTEGPAIIHYFTNGRCQPYALRIVDARGVATRITVDSLSKARTVEEN
jgi:prepilin-type N-terminal cleavage/methylation domain-containing protein